MGAQCEEIEGFGGKKDPANLKKDMAGRKNMAGRIERYGGKERYSVCLAFSASHPTSTWKRPRLCSAPWHA